MHVPSGNLLSEAVGLGRGGRKPGTDHTAHSMSQLPGFMVTQTLPLCPSGHLHSFPHTLPALLLDCSLLTAWHGELLFTNYFSYCLEKYNPDPSPRYKNKIKKQ